MISSSSVSLGDLFVGKSVKEALEFLYQTENFGFALKQTAYRFLFRRCSETQSLLLGRRVHCHLIKAGSPPDLYTSNTLLNMYVRNGDLGDAHQVFDGMPQRDIVSWNSIIAGYVGRGRNLEGCQLLKMMRRDGFGFDQYTFGTILKSSGSAGDLQFGQQIHSLVVRTGFHGNIFASSALLYMYTKCGKMDDAEVVFEFMPEKNAVSWNTMISGCAQTCKGERALQLLDQMEQEGIIPDQATFASILSSLGDPHSLRLVKQIHAKIVKFGLHFDVVVGNSAITAYSECESIEDAKLIFNQMKMLDLVTWNAMLAGYVCNDQSVEALGLFAEMQCHDVKLDIYTCTSLVSACCRFEHSEEGKTCHGLAVKAGLEESTPVSNALIAMYANFAMMDEALKLFGKMQYRDNVSWNSIIAGYSQCGLAEEAMKLYSQMLLHRVRLDHYTFSSVLRCCANLATLQWGKQIHVSIIKLGFKAHLFVGSALIYMYSRCGMIEDASRAFGETSKSGPVTWNSIIFAYAQHGQGESAIDIFKLMQEAGIKPDHITFVGILSACSHVGLVEEGSYFLMSMDAKYGIKPRMEHFACAIDLFGRAGLLQRAKLVIDSMPFKPNAMIWKTLLGACRAHRDIDLAKYAASFLLELEPNEHATYILLSNVFALHGEWDELAQLKRVMREKGLKKIAGCSWVEVKNIVHTFNAEDRSHPQAKAIYEKLKVLMKQIKGMGYVPDTEFVLHNLDEETKEQHLFYHSEKLAVVFAILTVPKGVTIRIMKNLRTCGDCHTAFKFISKAIDREIVMRDANRFHHFKSGTCSCGDYW
ncbi:putative pentatricopeptide repeat-containing protein [Nymphaea thermarum]|nr:putative pentatricopeptide repeat-containing protein [Nymphaea thermarum]